jgi:PAS domain S-box-containing protein
MDRVTELEDGISAPAATKDAMARELEVARHYRDAIDGSPLSILRVSGAKGRYVFVNEAFAKMMGQAREELLARDPYEAWMESAHPDDVEAERDAMGRLAKGELDSFQLDKRVIPRGGKARWVRMHAFGSRDVEGRLDCLTAYFTDIRQERELAQARDTLEAQLRQEQKFGAVGKLAGGVAHDFNNRLVVIMGHAELLARGLPRDSPLKRHAQTVLASAKRAAELTHQLLAYSRRQVLAPQAFDPNEMAERMRELLKTVLGDSIELLVNLDSKRKILADPGQIEQVILNLVLNARDAMPNGGRLMLDSRDVTVGEGELSGLRPGEYVALVVTDTGTGIPEDVFPHIFEPFFTTKEVGRGTGLGLSMVEGIVHQSGGATHVKTSTGKGTTFTIYLPHTTAPAALASLGKDVAPPPSGRSLETILVCDDDDEVRELLVALLQIRGYTILEAHDGMQALEVARRRQGHIHLLVTDMAMPGIGGIELATELRKQNATLKVLYLSGYTENADRLSSLLGPSTHFLAKPFLPGDLTRAASFILNGSEPPDGGSSATG